MRYPRHVYRVFIGLIVFAREFLPACSSAVDICRMPCDPGKFCDPYLGFCVSCEQYCQGQSDCLTACANNKPTTMMPTSTTQLTDVITSYSMTINSTSTAATASYPTNNPSIPLLPKGEHYEQLSLGLFFGLLFSMLVLVIIIVLLVLYRKTLKMPSLCCFSNGDSLNSENIELGEINHSPVERQTRIWVNPIVERPDYAPVQVDDDEDNCVMQPGPSGISGQNSLRRPNAEDANPTDPIPTTSSSRSGAGGAERYQSARVHQASAPSLECQGHLGAVPADHQSKQKTPETHRKIADGTLDGHEFAPGASRFGPYLPYQLEDFQCTREPGHGD